MSLVTLQNGILEVTISSMGAELQSIRDANGVERLWQGDPAYWANRAPILFPVAGGFREDAYELNGKRYPMGKHGYVRKLDWAVESADPTTATFLMRVQCARCCGLTHRCAPLQWMQGGLGGGGH